MYTSWYRLCSELGHCVTVNEVPISNLDDSMLATTIKIIGFAQGSPILWISLYQKSSVPTFFLWCHLFFLSFIDFWFDLQRKEGRPIVFQISYVINNAITLLIFISIYSSAGNQRREKQTNKDKGFYGFKDFVEFKGLREWPRRFDINTDFVVDTDCIGKPFKRVELEDGKQLLDNKYSVWRMLNDVIRSTCSACVHVE